MAHLNGDTRTVKAYLRFDYSLAQEKAVKLRESGLLVSFDLSQSSVRFCSDSVVDIEGISEQIDLFTVQPAVSPKRPPEKRGGGL